MTLPNGLETEGDLLSYSLEIEEEAVARYLELADTMETHNNSELAAFFRRMAEYEKKHVDQVKDLQRLSPQTPKVRWGDLGGREAPDWSEFHYLNLPHHAISIALGFERRAEAFFTDLAKAAKNTHVREMAQKFAGDEARHVHELQELLKVYPAPDDDWDYDPDPTADQE